ncbi:unnamed protein product, partial [marine sediment metagenome]
INYDLILAKAKKRAPELKEEDLRSFLPDKKKSTAEILGEWYRLWHFVITFCLSLTQPIIFTP